MWYHTYGFSNQYRCASSIYLQSWLYLEFSIFIDRELRSPVHGKDVVDGMNTRDKLMIKLSMSNILNTKLIWYDPNVFKFIQVQKNEEYQAVSLAKETRLFLS